MNLHIENEHIKYLKQLCRTCGERALTTKEKLKKYKPKKCENIKSDILVVFGINLCNDDPNNHSPFICGRCESKIFRVKKRSSEQCLSSARIVAKNNENIWMKFSSYVTINECTVCSKFLQTCKGEINYPCQSKKSQPQNIDDATALEISQDFKLNHLKTIVSTEINDEIVFHDHSESSMTTQNSTSGTEQVKTGSSQPIASSTPVKRKLMVDQMTSPAFKND